MRPSTERPFYLNAWYTGAPEIRRATPSNTMVRCRGMTVFFANGSSVEDWGGQWYVNNLGTGRAGMARVLAAASRRMSWVSPSDFAEVRLSLVRDLRRILPRHLTTPQFTVGGSDAMETAIRAARKVTGRRRILSLTQAYHGDTLAIENVNGLPRTPYGDRRPWAVHATSPCDLWEAAGRDWGRACDLALERLEAVLRRRGPRTFAAVIVEPVMAGPGAIPLSPGLARGLRALCDRHGIKLVADEVVTGFGRTGRWFGSETVGLVPDAMVLAKGMTGGYAPLGAVVFERAWGGELRRTGLNHGLTFAGHPLGCAAAREAVRILGKERLVERCAMVGGRLRTGLEALRAAHPDAVADVRGRGLLLALQLERRPAPGRRAGGAAARVAALATAARAARLQLLPTNDGTGLLFAPPFTVTPRQIDRLLGFLDRSLARP